MATTLPTKFSDEALRIYDAEKDVDSLTTVAATSLMNKEDKIQSPPIYLNSYKDKVKKLKKRLHDLGKQHNTLLDNAKNNAKIAQNRIKALEKKVADLAEIADLLGKIAKNSQKLYKEYIKYTAALAATGKDPGEILRPY
ncbi:hypothetical protein FOMG_11505 [Fusarium oxysporum f. sp. melonis 26406]|uniref:Uncharacterized protein n=1 Tax=Fusarium oxysporum f. sp. melonis 26406 TaxID=1089452 RepID=X0AHG9_FUSOX|nr:hypothetical protein FOMG_11505 [Fusarium oxysporum f. sp. melonis 26406]